MILLPVAGAMYSTRRDSEWLHSGPNRRTSIIPVPEGTHILIIEIEQSNAWMPNKYSKVDALLPTNMLVYLAGENHSWFGLLKRMSEND